MNIVEFNTPKLRCGASIGLSILTSQFGSPVSKTVVIVPDTYNNDTSIDDYIMNVREEKKVCHLSIEFTSDNFNKVTDVLKGGFRYKVVLVPIIQPVSGQDCVNFMADNNYMFVGAQGLILAQGSDNGKFLTNNNWVASFDREHALYLGSTGLYKVPVSYNNCGKGSGRLNSVIHGGLRLGLRPFQNSWRMGDYLLCYSEE